MGRFANAAKLEKEIAEMYEANNESEKCVKHYQKAADYFLGEDSTAAANQCLLKVAHFNALLEKYDDAVKIYEDVAQACLEKNVLKFNAKGHLFCAGILHLVRGVCYKFDPISANNNPVFQGRIIFFLHLLLFHYSTV